MTPLTIGVGAFRGRQYQFSQIIKRNTPLPASNNCDYLTIKDNQTSVQFEILQGEHKLAAENFKIGVFEVSGIPPAKAGVEKVTVTFTVDENGILNATVVSHSNSAAKSEVTIENVFGNLLQNQIENLVNEAEKYREAEKTRKFQEFGLYCYDVRDNVGKYNSVVRKKCLEALYWLKSGSRHEVADIEQKRNELEQIVATSEQMEIDDDDVIVLPHEDIIICLNDDDD